MPVIPNPNPPTPTVDVNQELQTQRELTEWFIAEDPTTIILIPRVETVGVGGGVQTADGTPRDPQTFKVIPMNHTERPVASGFGGGEANSGGVQRKFDYTIVGKYDAIVGIGDYWEDPSGQKYIVDAINPYNNYEVKAMVTTYGRKPDHG